MSLMSLLINVMHPCWINVLIYSEPQTFELQYVYMDCYAQNNDKKVHKTTKK